MDALPPDIAAHQAACIVQASQAYGVDAMAIGRELVLRDGRRGMIYSTPDGGFEIGVMRIPATALPALGARGITRDKLAWDDCVNIQVGAQMLRLRIEQAGQVATAQNQVQPTPASPPVVMRMLPDSAADVVPAAAPVASMSGTRMQCVEAASRRYGVHPHLIQAVIKTEGGTTGKISRNTNGSYDMGVMQINSIHLPELARMGITREKVIGDECTNIFVGTFKLREAIDGGADFWHGVSRYHSRTPSKGQVYLAKVAANLRQIIAATSQVRQ